jgi:hypothetical protein
LHTISDDPRKIGCNRTGGSRECETSGSKPQPPVKEQEQQRRLARRAADIHLERDAKVVKTSRRVDARVISVTAPSLSRSASDWIAGVVFSCAASSSRWVTVVAAGACHRMTLLLTAAASADTSQGYMAGKLTDPPITGCGILEYTIGKARRRE